MRNFNKGNDRGGFRPGNREVSMHKAVCSGCGKNCEVPFRPTGNKPVYCNNCFARVRAAEGAGGRGGNIDRLSRRDFEGGEQWRDSHRNFPLKQNLESHKNDFLPDIVRQLEAINTKLDRLIRAIEKPPMTFEVQNEKPETLKQAVKKAIDSKKKK